MFFGARLLIKKLLRWRPDHCIVGSACTRRPQFNLSAGQDFVVTDDDFYQDWGDQ